MTVAERREGKGVLTGFHFNAGGIALARHMQCPYVQDNNANQHEWQQIVQREEALQGGVVHRETAPQPCHNGFAEEWYGREQVGDDFRAPEAHLAPRQHIAHEAGCHHDKENRHAKHPQDFAGCLVGPVIHAARDVDIDCDEEERCANGMPLLQDVAVIHVAADVFDRIECHVDVRRVVHDQHDAGDDLRDHHDHQDTAERVPVVQVARHRVADKTVIHKPRQWQPVIDPFHHGISRIVSGVSAHGVFPQPIWIFTSLKY